MNEIDEFALYSALLGLITILGGSLVVLMTLFQMSLTRAVKRHKLFNKKGEKAEIKIRCY